MMRDTLRRALSAILAAALVLCFVSGVSGVRVPAAADAAGASGTDGILLTDDDGDGILTCRFRYRGACVYALIVPDPSRVFVGTALPEPSQWGGFGLTLDRMLEQYGAVAGINAGGFLDDGGGGNGWPPSGITYSRGINFSTDAFDAVAGLDREDRLWSGYYSFEECEKLGIRDAVCFGPVLVDNGVKTDPGLYESGIGARTAVGQREDGAVVLAVADGRQGYSIGITFEDMANIMADRFGCVSACNMDGGNSSCMYLAGQSVNRSANQAGGTRYLPDAWLVSPLPEDYERPADVPETITLTGTLPGEEREYTGQWDREAADSMYGFAAAFTEAYYGYFGTSYADYYYPMLSRYAAAGSDLRWRMDLALMDRTWVNTWQTDSNDLTVDGVFENPDGTVDLLITSDIYEHSTYWNFEAPAVTLRLTLTEAPGTEYGWLVSEVW